MSFFGLFRRKHESPPFPSPLPQASSGYALEPDSQAGLSRSPFLEPLDSPLSAPAFSSAMQDVRADKDMQLILSKLDMINSKLDMLNRRLETLERASVQEQAPPTPTFQSPRRMW